MLEFLKALILFVLVVFGMVILAPLAPLIIPLILFLFAATAVVLALIAAYYLRAVLIPLGVVAIPLYGIWWTIANIQVPRITVPAISIPSITIPSLSIYGIPSFFYIPAGIGILIIIYYIIGAIAAFADGIEQGRIENRHVASTEGAEMPERYRPVPDIDSDSDDGDARREIDEPDEPEYPIDPLFDPGF